MTTTTTHEHESAADTFRAVRGYAWHCLRRQVRLWDSNPSNHGRQHWLTSANRSRDPNRPGLNSADWEEAVDDIVAQAWAMQHDDDGDGAEIGIFAGVCRAARLYVWRPNSGRFIPQQRRNGAQTTVMALDLGTGGVPVPVAPNHAEPPRREPWDGETLLDALEASGMSQGEVNLLVGLAKGETYEFALESAGYSRTSRRIVPAAKRKAQAALAYWPLCRTLAEVATEPADDLPPELHPVVDVSSDWTSAVVVVDHVRDLYGEMLRSQLRWDRDAEIAQAEYAATAHNEEADRLHAAWEAAVENAPKRWARLIGRAVKACPSVVRGGEVDIRRVTAWASTHDKIGLAAAQKATAESRFLPDYVAEVRGLAIQAIRYADRLRSTADAPTTVVAPHGPKPRTERPQAVPVRIAPPKALPLCSPHDPPSRMERGRMARAASAIRLGLGGLGERSRVPLD